MFAERDRIAAQVALKVPESHVEEVTDQVLDRALKAAFDGDSVGEFRSLLATIRRRAIAEFHRGARSKLRTVGLDVEGAQDTHERALADPGPDPVDAVATTWATDQALAALRPHHRHVVRRFVFDDLTAADTCAEVEGMTTDNVSQIARRFRADLRRRLEEQDG